MWTFASELVAPSHGPMKEINDSDFLQMASKIQQQNCILASASERGMSNPCMDIKSQVKLISFSVSHPAGSSLSHLCHTSSPWLARDGFDTNMSSVLFLNLFAWPSLLPFIEAFPHLVRVQKWQASREHLCSCTTFQICEGYRESPSHPLYSAHCTAGWRWP